MPSGLDQRNGFLSQVEGLLFCKGLLLGLTLFFQDLLPSTEVYIIWPHVLKSSEEDFAKNGKRYDLILAAAGYRSLFYYTRALSPKGIYVVTEGSMAQIFQPMLLGPWITMTESKKMDNLSVRPNQEDLVIMKELIETGKVKSVINRCYTLSEIAEALRYCDEGHARVKVVISLEHNNKT